MEVYVRARAILEEIMQFKGLYLGLLVYAENGTLYQNLSEPQEDWYKRQRFTLTDEGVASYEAHEKVVIDGMGVFSDKEGANLLFYLMTGFPMIIPAGGSAEMRFNEDD